MSLTRDESIFMAKLFEQAERYEEMLEHIKIAANYNPELNIEERNLFSVASKNIVNSTRTALRVLHALVDKDVFKESTYADLVKDYIKKVKREYESKCCEILYYLEKQLMPYSKTPDCKIFYKRMKGDLHRYIAEETQDLAHKKASMEAYKAADEIVMKHYKATSPYRLGMALSKAVFYYEILNQPEEAIQLAKSAFDAAITEIENITDAEYKESTILMQLLRDNLTSWTS